MPPAFPPQQGDFYESEICTLSSVGSHRPGRHRLVDMGSCNLGQKLRRNREIWTLLVR